MGKYHCMSAHIKHTIRLQLRTRPLSSQPLDILHKTRTKIVEKLGGKIENKQGLLHHWFCLVIYENSSKYAWISYKNVAESWYHGRGELEFELGDFDASKTEPSQNNSSFDSHEILEEWQADVGTFV